MKSRFQLVLICSVAISFSAEAQFFKKLAKKAEKAAERTILNRTDEEVSKGTDKAIDGIAGGENGSTNTDGSNSQKGTATVPAGTKFENPSLAKNTDAKWAWYTSDVRVTSYDREKQSNMVSYFDADAVAMRSEYTDQETGMPITSYTDSEGFFISYNESEQRYTKTGLLAMPGMSMMAPSMMANAYKLPESAIFGAMEAMEEKGLAVYPFMHVDFPFAIRPEHFRDEFIAGKYEESKLSCRDGAACTKFSVLETEHEGSYILFDNQNRLVEINIVMKDDPFYGSGKGKIEYFYEDCEVKLPAAVEKKMPGQDLFKMGMDPNSN